MAEENNAENKSEVAAENAEENQQEFQIQRIYLKDLSLEQPNSPQILLEQENPEVDINIAVENQNIAENVYESAITATVTTKIGDKTLFLCEAKQAGIFLVAGFDAETTDAIVGINCPTIVYPYLRAVVSETIVKAGFPPVMLNELNFQAVYEQQKAQEQSGSIN